MSKHWTFLSHHAHVLLALSENPDHTIEELAKIAELTPRSMVNILRDLEEGGYLVKTKEGRNNHYEINLAAQLRHSTSNKRTVGELLAALNQIGN
jgi:DNA-binding IclR family transcriptional regulator